MSPREPGQGRRDLRKYTEKGALQKGHGEPRGCRKTLAVLVLAGPSAPVMAVGAGWVLADLLIGGGHA